MIYEIVRINLHYEDCRKYCRQVEFLEINFKIHCPSTGRKVNTMAKKQINKPTDAELEILQVLWNEGPSPVRHVNERMSEKREIGYTTTLKLMQIMLEKGLVKRNTETRSHIYSAAIERSETQRNLLGKFVDNVFRGSAADLVMQALGHHNASAEELEEIKKLIDKIEKEK